MPRHTYDQVMSDRHHYVQGWMAAVDSALAKGLELDAMSQYVTANEHATRLFPLVPNTLEGC